MSCVIEVEAQHFDDHGDVFILRKSIPFFALPRVGEWVTIHGTLHSFRAEVWAIEWEKEDEPPRVYLKPADNGEYRPLGQRDALLEAGFR
jgi:hypothetical protein